MSEHTPTPELLPCPFCGGKAYEAVGDDCEYVGCYQCNAEGPFNTGNTEAKARAEWNNRVPDPASQRQIKELREALDPIRKYVWARQLQPLKGTGDSVHQIHVGTAYEAELLFSHLEALVALSNEREG